MKWNEFWDMFEASVHKDKRYADIDKFTYLKSKLSSDTLEAIAVYQLLNDNYKIVVDVLKKRFGNKKVQLSILTIIIYHTYLWPLTKLVVCVSVMIPLKEI